MTEIIQILTIIVLSLVAILLLIYILPVIYVLFYSLLSSLEDFISDVIYKIREHRKRNKKVDK